MTQPLTIEDFVDISQVLHGDQFQKISPFDLVGKPLGKWISRFLESKGVQSEPVVKGKVHSTAVIEGAVFIEEGAIVEPHAYIQGPTYIGPDAQVRHCAYIRGNVYVGARAVVGHTTEAKGAVFFDDAKAGHFAYVGDSILGRNTNLGAGTKLANLGLLRKEVRIMHPNSDELVGTGHEKFGAIMSDDAQTGCNAVLNPGSVLMQRTLVLGGTSFLGTLKRGYSGSITRVGQ
jgi:UDP-N-acetylglucosamine diphosphorylase / glucose-1-phosphate thymidylyltransferase / UDP-N-acetylgalactosamine diphosphorylase / glucosamine-1-phosphate N-acetyltransferase / galactosamine-1-phosphate N-acetyltransferase